MIFQKRGKWCFRDSNGRLHKFESESDAKELYNSLSPSIEIEMPKIEMPELELFDEDLEYVEED